MHDDPTIDDPAFALMRRSEVAELLAKLLHSPVAPRTIGAWPIPYIRVGHTALYKREDVEAFARQRLTDAPRYIGRNDVPPRSTPMVWGAKRLVAAPGNAGSPPKTRPAEASVVPSPPTAHTRPLRRNENKAKGRAL
jgi:hypothetical protein